jgi:hypothetical protein
VAIEDDGGAGAAQPAERGDPADDLLAAVVVLPRPSPRAEQVVAVDQVRQDGLRS